MGGVQVDESENIAELGARLKSAKESSVSLDFLFAHYHWKITIMRLKPKIEIAVSD